FLFSASRRFCFLARWRLRLFRWSSFRFFFLCRLCFRLLLGLRFRCWCCGLRLRLFLHLRNPLVLWEHPVLQVRRNNSSSFLILINFDHARGARSTSPSRNTSDK